jgi:hypothetical protein
MNVTGNYNKYKGLASAVQCYEWYGKNLDRQYVRM